MTALTPMGRLGEPEEIAAGGRVPRERRRLVRHRARAVRGRRLHGALSADSRAAAWTVDELEESGRDQLRGWRAAGDAQVDGEHGVDRADELVRSAEEAAAERAVAEGGDAPGSGIAG